jgi:hypothetical protein
MSWVWRYILGLQITWKVEAGYSLLCGQALRPKKEEEEEEEKKEDGKEEEEE